MLLKLEGGVVSAALHHGYITSASVEEEGGRLQSSRLSLKLINSFITATGPNQRQNKQGATTWRLFGSVASLVRKHQLHRLTDRLRLVSVSAVLTRTRLSHRL